MAKDFKVGDKIRFIGNCNSAVDGKIYIVEIDKEGLGVGDSKSNLCHCLGQWEFISNNQNNMSIKEKFITAFLKEPEKSFRKAGITNGDGFLTEDGQNVFLSYLLQKNGDAFKTEVVDGLLAEEKDCGGCK